MTDNATIDPKGLAVLFDTDAKTIRRFLRSLVESDNRPGKGGKWTIDANMVDALKIRFDAWNARTARTLTIADISD